MEAVEVNRTILSLTGEFILSNSGELIAISNSGKNSFMLTLKTGEFLNKPGSS